MGKTEVKDALLECKEISSDIMDKVTELLTEEGIGYTQNSDSEIIINGKEKSEIKDLLYTMEDVTKQQIKMVLQISDVNGNTFIRQKFN